MTSQTKMHLSTRIVQVSLFIAAAIALFGGTLQMYLGEPETTPRLDNVHRFMAGIYFSMGIICFWSALTIRKQDTLVYLIAFGIGFAALGRLISISIVGLPEPSAVWIGYLVPEILLPMILIIANRISLRNSSR
ncbi:DUF4345 domain-containing protein [Leptospira ognonensis]|uniref:DUF4345 domain-containing protein n=2 Tax=Leptospira ognonensis TaxID=2484945 RepID=A0A4R9K8U7_9LEPT|nr:DUF4345 domain-containing protein [Leptospira ognonensis]